MTDKNNSLIEKAIKDGHLIAEKIKNANSVVEIDDLTDEIEEYCDFIDENFGVVNDFDEKKCELSTTLFMATEEKARQLEYYPEKKALGNDDIIDFENMLDSKYWANVK